MSRDDPWITWMDTLLLLEHEHGFVRLGAVTALERLARNEELSGPTAQVLKCALKEWENKNPKLPEDVSAAARRLLTSLEGEGRTLADGAS